MRILTVAVLVLLSIRLAGQQPTTTQPGIAITFEDLPVHGPLPVGETRLQIAQSILSTLEANHMPPVYGFVNARRLELADPVHASTNTRDITSTSPDYASLEAWRAAGEPLGNHTANHLSLDDLSAGEFEQNILDDESILIALMQDHDWRWFRFPYLQEGDTLEKHREVQKWLRAHITVLQKSRWTSKITFGTLPMPVAL